MKKHILQLATFIVGMMAAQSILYVFGMEWDKTIWCAFLILIVYLTMDTVDDYWRDRYEQR